MSEVGRIRVAAAAIAVLFLVATGLLCRDPIRRGTLQYLFVITLGYGHLIGGLVFSRARLAYLVPAGVSPLLFSAFVASSLATVFAGYAAVVFAHPEAVVPILAISIWHVAENDRALVLGGGGGLAAFTMRRAFDPQVIATTLALGVLAAALLGPVAGPFDTRPLETARRALGLPLRGITWFGFADLFASVTLYHLAAFLLHFRMRSKALHAAGADVAPRGRRLFWVHAPPALLCAALLATPDPRAVAARDFVFSPGIYLFWSLLHVAQTLAARVAPRPARIAVGDS
jgi:hypothetical protein